MSDLTDERIAAHITHGGLTHREVDAALRELLSLRALSRSHREAGTGVAGDLPIPDDDYWQMAVAEIEAAGTSFRHAVLTNHHAATLLAWANLARDAALASPQRETEGREITEPLEVAAAALALTKKIEAVFYHDHPGGAGQARAKVQSLLVKALDRAVLQPLQEKTPKS